MKEIVLKLIDQLPAILIAAASLLGAMFAWRNGKKADVLKTQNEATAIKTDGLKTQGEEIHTLVNGNLQKLRDRLADAILRVQQLEAERDAKKAQP